ncbi:hypothetical protein KR059_003714 [Drosophila kikkawai]|nr:hypothetical protein KR059_003714 [Drosophila kikkawai]
MESINHIIDPRPTYSQDLVENATEFMNEHQSQSHQEGGGPGSGSELDADEVLSIQTMISEKKQRSRPDSAAVVMVIDEMDRQTTTYQIVPHEQLQQLQQPRTMSFGIVQHDLHHEQPMIDNSPVDSFVASDISLDGLTVDAISQAAILPQELTTVKPDAMSKLLIVQTKSGMDPANNKRIKMHVDLSSANVGLGANVDDVDEISSDGDNCDDVGVTLNQHHHQQLLDGHQQVFSLASHHHQHQHHQHHHHLHAHGHGQVILGLQHNRSGQLDMGHGMAGGVIVTSQDSEKDADDEDDNGNGDPDGDVEDEDDDEIRNRGQLISQGSYQTLTSVNDRLSPPGFSPTSYATLTPIQPLPPISTMSEKFAYSGHISGSGDSGDNTDVTGVERGREEAITNASSETEVEGGNSSGIGNGTASECNSYSSALPLTMSGGHHHLGLGVSPYSSYEKLTSMISPPPNNYLVSCDLHSATVVTSSGRMPNPSQLEELSHNGHKKDSATQENSDDNVGGGSGEEKFTYSGHISGGGDSGDTDIQGEKFAYSDHISGGDSADTDVHGEKFSYSDHISGGDNVSDVNGGTSWVHLASERESRLHMPSEHSLEDRFHLASERKTRLNMAAQERTTATRLQMPRHLHHQATAAAVSSICTTDWKPDEDWKHGSNSILPVVVSLTPTPPPPSITDVDRASTVPLKLSGRMSPGNQRSQQYFLDKSQQQEIGGATDNVIADSSVCGIQQSSLLNGFQNIQQQCAKIAISASPKNGGGGGGGAGGSSSRTSGNSTDMEEINTKDLAQRISAELKRYSIPQAIFAQRVLCRSQGTLSDLLRNPKPWSKLKSGRETFRRMYKWLQEPEFQRMSALRMAAAQIPQRMTPLGSANTAATGLLGSVGTGTGTNDNRDVMTTDADPHGGPLPMSPRGKLRSAAGPNLPVSSNVAANCRRKEEPQIEQMPQPKKPRLVFTDLQRRTLQAIFKETKRPSKEMQVTIARQLGLEPTTVGNFFMNARRRSMDKWRDDDSKNNSNMQHVIQNRQQQAQDEQDEDHSQTPNHIHNQNHNPSQSLSHDNYSSLHTTAMSPLGAFDEDADMDLELESHDFDLVDPDHQADNNNDRHGDML